MWPGDDSAPPGGSGATAAPASGDTRLAAATAQLEMVLDSIQHGVVLVDAEGRVQLCNRVACVLLGLPEIPGTFAALVASLKRFPLLSEAAGAATIAVTPSCFVEIHVRPTAHRGSVIVIEDVTDERERERALRQAESEYRSLFENSVSGIYRDTLDGLPLRVNPALAALNGYQGEREQIEAVRSSPGDWYVDQDRAAEFHETLARDGKVKDFVSQVYRHRTRERLWITENAWYVRDAEGRPLFVEGTIEDATERIAAQENMARLADLDMLTGARSRFRFMQRLAAETEKPGNSFVVYCVDLDTFKDINDVFGHAAGDAVLKAVAERLFGLAGPADVVARLGGDEFALISAAPANVDEPARLARAIVEAMRAPVAIDGRDHYVGVSVGAAAFPAHGAGAEELLKNADTALYQAKARGRNGWRVFDLELHAAQQQRKRLEDGLRTAIVRGELSLHFQPIVSAEGNVLAFESLMRWRHPEFGNVPPAEFIPIAEQAGLMAELGAFAVSRACEALGSLPPPLRVGVNVSANQFRTPGFVAHVEAELRRCEVEPSRLVLEITESVLVESGHAARLLVAELRAIGVRIAIDDFGTGHSALSYLQHLPINTVKIDRSFVAGLATEKANLAVIRAIIGIGRDLGIQIVAEGIETEAQAEALRREGCTMLQGYLFGRPRPLTDAVADLAVGLLTPAADPPETEPGRQAG